MAVHDGAHAWRRHRQPHPAIGLRQLAHLPFKAVQLAHQHLMHGKRALAMALKAG